MGLIKLALEKQSGLWDGLGKGLWAAGKQLMGNKVIRNAAIGSAVGAVGGAANAQEGQRLSGAFKGGLLGGAIGGAGTYAKQVANTAKQLGPNATLGAAVKATGDAGMGNTFKNATSLFKNQRSLAQGLGSTLPTLGTNVPTEVSLNNLKNKFNRPL